MKRSLLFLSLMLLILSFAVSQTKVLRADHNKEGEEEIKKLEFTLADLLMKRDLETYATYNAEDYVRIDSQGGLKTRDEILAELKSSKPSSLKPDNLKVRIYGDTAILNGHLRWKGSVKGKDIARESLFRKVFVKRDGRWYMVNNQGTLVSQREEQR